jgi:hypothetical protein
MALIVILHLLKTASRAEYHPIISSTRTGKGACWVIFGIAICIRAPLLEKPREIYWTTIARIATVLNCLENSAWIVATSWGPELIWALPIDISRTLDSTAAA